MRLERYMKIFVAVLLALLCPGFSSSTEAEHFSHCTTLLAAHISEHLSCDDEHSRVLEIQSGEQKGKKLYLDSLLSSPELPPVLVCRKFLHTLSSTATPEKKIELCWMEDEEVSDPAQGRIQAGEFEQLCAQHGFCLRHPLDIPTIDPALRACLPKLSFKNAAQMSIPKLRKASPKIIKELTLTFFPWESLGELTLQSFALPTQLPALVSTMTIGRGTATQILQASKLSGRPLFLLLDYPVALGQDMGTLLDVYFSNNKRVKLIPIAPSGGYASVFHSKILLDPTRKDIVLTSTNLSSPQKAAYIDALYHIRDPLAGRELRERSLRYVRDACEQEDSLRCVRNFMNTPTETPKKESEDFFDGFRKSCRAFHDLWPARDHTSPERYFLDSQDDDVLDYVQERIENAESEIILFTHKFSLPDLRSALDSAQKRGVSILGFGSRPYQGNSTEDPRRPNWYMLASDRQGFAPEPHLKAILIDRKLLFFGTGNFSKNAFHDAEELFAVTDNKEAIETLLRLASSYLAMRSPERKKYFRLSSALEQWRLRDEEKDSQASDTPQQLRNYQKLSVDLQKKLAACGLDEPILFREQDIQRCLNTLKLKKELRSKEKRAVHAQGKS
jgi:hypothetical protein